MTESTENDRESEIEREEKKAKIMCEKIRPAIYIQVCSVHSMCFAFSSFVICFCVFFSRWICRMCQIWTNRIICIKSIMRAEQIYLKAYTRAKNEQKKKPAIHQSVHPSMYEGENTFKFYVCPLPLLILVLLFLLCRCWCWCRCLPSNEHCIFKYKPNEMKWNAILYIST